MEQRAINIVKVIVASLQEQDLRSIFPLVFFKISLSFLMQACRYIKYINAKTLKLSKPVMPCKAMKWANTLCA